MSALRIRGTKAVTPLVVVKRREVMRLRNRQAAGGLALAGPPSRLRIRSAPGHPAAAPSDGSPEAPAAAPRKLRVPLSTFFSRRYKLLARINDGGMGHVYKAMDAMLDMPVAIKFLPRSLAKNPGAMANLKSEAAIVIALSHPAIVRLHNIEVERGRMFLVMEYVDGEDMRNALRRLGRLSVASVMEIARSCAGALAYAHGRKVLHRDLTPDNLMVDLEGRLKIVDFGIARRTRSAPGTFVEGTPGYMSPEQLRGEVLDERTDIFSLGAVLCELLTGKAVFPDRADLTRLFVRPPQGLAELPPEFAGVLAKAFELDREQRWASVVEFMAALEKAAAAAKAQ